MIFQVQAPRYSDNFTSGKTNRNSSTFSEIPTQHDAKPIVADGSYISKLPSETIVVSSDSQKLSVHWDITVNLSLFSTNSCERINQSIYETADNKITIIPKMLFGNSTSNNILETPHSTYGANVSDEDVNHIISKTIRVSQRKETSFLALYFLINTNHSMKDGSSSDYDIFRCFFTINDTMITEILDNEPIFWWRRKPNNRNISLMLRFLGPYESSEFNLREIVEDIDKFVTPSYCSSKIPFFYSLVISGDLKRNSVFLSFININYILSTCSLFLIFLTAKLSIEWRQRKSNIILTNFTVAIFSQIILHFVSDFTEVDEGLCTIVTILCHYFTLVQFFWTSTIAYMQYRRYVQVFEEHDEFFLIKHIAFAWVTPILLISTFLIIVFSMPNNTTNCEDNFKICSLINTYLLNYCIAIPLILTLATNFIFFILIFRHLLKRKLEFDQKTSALLEVKLAFVLFFLLDLNLIVAIIADMFSIDFLASIFVTSHSLQGVLLFVVFVIRNKCSRKMYVRWIKIACDRLTFRKRC